jgi:D-glycero-alpha-D-manno-heptose-7-phosphate kinase
MRIESRAPTRIDLAGGTLDIWPLYLYHEGAVTVNCAITRYASCTLEVLPHRKTIKLASRDTRRAQSFSSLAALERCRKHRLPLLAYLVRHFRPRVGLSLSTNSEAPAGAGIGGSSAMAVALCAALDRLTKAGQDRDDWIAISRDIEAIVINVPTGTQDHYPPAFGGAAAIHLEPGRVRREALRVNLDELERRVVVCYTGEPRQSGINNWKVFRAHVDGDRRVYQNLEVISQVAQAMRAALERGQWREVARLMREEWSYRRRNLPTITTPVIDRIIAGARRAGAMAGKVNGAGGGGCVTLLIEPDARAAVERAIVAGGGTVLPLRLDRRGVTVRVSR